MISLSSCAVSKDRFDKWNELVCTDDSGLSWKEQCWAFGAAGSSLSCTWYYTTAFRKAYRWTSLSLSLGSASNSHQTAAFFFRIQFSTPFLANKKQKILRNKPEQLISVCREISPPRHTRVRLSDLVSGRAAFWSSWEVIYHSCLWIKMTKLNSVNNQRIIMRVNRGHCPWHFCHTSPSNCSLLIVLHFLQGQVSH